MTAGLFEITLEDDDAALVTTDSGFVKINGTTTTYSASAVEAIAVYGGSDDNEIDPSAGDDRIAGDAGDDFLFGDLGEDILAGGDDTDILVGEADSDILLPGSFDPSGIGAEATLSEIRAAITTILASWASEEDDADRVANVTGDAGAPDPLPSGLQFLLNDSVLDDATIDVVAGNADLDLLFFDGRQDILFVPDVGETLADFSANLAPYDATFADGVLTITNLGADDIVITVEEGFVLINGDEPTFGALAAEDAQSLVLRARSDKGRFNLSDVTPEDFENLEGIATDYNFSDGQDPALFLLQSLSATFVANAEDLLEAFPLTYQEFAAVLAGDYSSIEQGRLDEFFVEAAELVTTSDLFVFYAYLSATGMDLAEYSPSLVEMLFGGAEMLMMMRGGGGKGSDSIFKGLKAVESEWMELAVEALLPNGSKGGGESMMRLTGDGGEGTDNIIGSSAEGSIEGGEGGDILYTNPTADNDAPYSGESASASRS